MSLEIKQKIKERADQLGFDLIGIAPARTSSDADEYRNWIASGYQAKMGWMARDPERRIDVRRVLPRGMSIVSVGKSYYSEEPPPKIWSNPLRGRVARFAWGLDYHDVLRQPLKSLAEFIETESGGGVETRFYTDTGPVLERSHACSAGLGYPGYNTNLIAPGYGSYLLLGEIITTAEIAPDSSAESIAESCAACRRCLEACPTGALQSAYVCDSRKCISYLTIENKGPIPEELRPKLGNWIFGCDACQECCPHVQQSTPSSKDSFLCFDAERSAPDLRELIKIDEEEFRRRFKGTPIFRAKRKGLLRNAAIALGNSLDPQALPALELAARDEEELVREHASWAIDHIVQNT